MMLTYLPIKKPDDTKNKSKYKYKTTNEMMMTYLPIEKPDDTEHKNKYKEGGGESGTAKRITYVSLLSMVNYL